MATTLGSSLAQMSLQKVAGPVASSTGSRQNMNAVNSNFYGNSLAVRVNQPMWFRKSSRSSTSKVANAMKGATDGHVHDTTASSSIKTAMVATLAALAIGQMSVSPAFAENEGPFAKQAADLAARIEEAKNRPQEFNNEIAAKVGYGQGAKGERDDQVEALESAPPGSFNLGARPSKSGSTNFGQTGDSDGSYGQNQ